MSFFKIIKFAWIIRRTVKAQRRSRKEIKTESRDDLFTDTLSFMVQKKGDRLNTDEGGKG